jgi:hypothetical protein
MPTFAFLYAPAYLTVHLLCLQNAPLPLLLLEIHSFGTMLLVPGIFGARSLDQ